MRTTERWRQHLNELKSAALDPVVYAVQWARDPRCMHQGVSHRRVGATRPDAPVCPLWSGASRRAWG
ncbi:MAG TPA: hypothetical protein VFR96_05390 [Povalibacter sp.]|nr:hypothetical protein [Povalibacter sp.]